MEDHREARCSAQRYGLLVFALMVYHHAEVDECCAVLIHRQGVGLVILAVRLEL
jgi:hypothetical protein